MRSAPGRRPSTLTAFALVLLLTPTNASAGFGTGRVELPTATAVPARLAYLSMPSTNGTFGYVLPLGGPVADGTPYQLRRTAGIDPVDLDVWFYSDLYGNAGEGFLCPPAGPRARPDGNGGEDGTINCGDSNGDGVPTAADRARYAIVFLFTGARTSFTLSW